MTSDLGSPRYPATPQGPLVLETPNPLDLSVDQLSELAVQLTDLMAADGLGGVPVTVRGDEPFGAGNNWTDILNIVLPNADFIKDSIYTALITGPVTAFIRKRFTRKHESTRPRHVRILAPDGRLLVGQPVRPEIMEVIV